MGVSGSKIKMGGKKGTDKGGKVDTTQARKSGTPGTKQGGEITADKVYKLVMLGDGGVGKTAMTIRFVSDRFVQEYDPTVEDAYKKEHQIDGKDITVEIIDTAGQEEYTSGLQDKFIRGGEGFILVYSITSRPSLNRVKEIRNKIAWTKDSEEVAMILVGNKSDLVKERQVPTQEGKEVAQEFGCPFLETSAKTGENVAECMRLLFLEIGKFGTADPAR